MFKKKIKQKNFKKQKVIVWNRAEQIVNCLFLPNETLMFFKGKEKMRLWADISCFGEILAKNIQVEGRKFSRSEGKNCNR